MQAARRRQDDRIEIVTGQQLIPVIHRAVVEIRRFAERLLDLVQRIPDVRILLWVSHVCDGFDADVLLLQHGVEQPVASATNAHKAQAEGLVGIDRFRARPGRGHQDRPAVSHGTAGRARQPGDGGDLGRRSQEIASTCWNHV